MQRTGLRTLHFMSILASVFVITALASPVRGGAAELPDAAKLMEQLIQAGGGEAALRSTMPKR